ncbi:MAG: PEP-CTERM sorting domain-containing protein [Verrucomicrobia subdivision 3 bacterium]|nr:PEP-CTERM sorting domain-containing protein [Limisphaerales bacterium]
MKSLFRAPALAVAMLGTITSAQADYANPPSWMPMTMLMASFNNTTLKLSVMNPSIVPVLTLAPAGTYDPAQPWAVLNGTEYSRRLGWDDLNKANPDPATHLLNQIHSTYGPGANVWIDCLNKTTGLECYLAVGMDGTGSPNSYSGIFGTAGSSTKWLWDGMMDHNTYAVDEALAAPGQLFSATYKVYVGDALGNEILNPDQSSASTMETWTWQAVPEPTTLSLAALGILGLLASRRIKS